jgi:hypothetical protein
MEMFATLGCHQPFKLITWVDTSYIMNEDMKSQTGGCSMLGHGVFMTKSSKQKLNTKSSTEAELVGATDHLPNAIWAKAFLRSRGYPKQLHVLNQDHKSAIQLKKNGRSSAGQKSRHISVCYFFMKDRIENNVITLQHCPTKIM